MRACSTFLLLLHWVINHVGYQHTIPDPHKPTSGTYRPSRACSQSNLPNLAAFNEQSQITMMLMTMITKIMFLFLGAAPAEKLSTACTRPNTGWSGPNPSLTEEGRAAATCNERFGRYILRNIGAVLLSRPLIFFFLPKKNSCHMTSEESPKKPAAPS